MTAENKMLSLRRPGHCESSFGEFTKMFEKQEMVDVILSCEEGEIQAHKLILSANSSYFKSLFARLSRNHSSNFPVVVIKDISFADLQVLVEFMYKGEIKIPRERLAILLKNAKSLRVNGLSNLDADEASKSAATSSKGRRKRKKRRTVTTSQAPQGFQDMCHDLTDQSEMTETEDDITEVIEVAENPPGEPDDIEPCRLLEQTMTINGEVRIFESVDLAKHLTLQAANRNAGMRTQSDQNLNRKLRRYTC